MIKRDGVLKKIKLFCFFVSVFIPVFCSAAEKPVVFVSIVPQKFFVQQICGDLLTVEVMVQPGASPATYEPKPSQMAKLSASLVYYAIGVPFENTWLKKISAVNPQMLVVHTDQGIDKISMAEHHHDSDDSTHGSHVEQQHGIPDPHIWLAPGLVKKQALLLFDSLKTILPEHQQQLEVNYKNFITQLELLDEGLRQIFKGREGMQFMVFHPSWGYFADAYDLSQKPIELEGKNPKPSQLGELIQHARENNIHVIFAQPQFSKKSAKVIAREIDGQVIVADPLAEDWFGNLRAVAKKIKTAGR